jgi:hypothetical protein
MDSCDSLTTKNYQCSNKAKYCIAYNGEKINFCSHHLKYHSGVDEPKSIVNPDYYYDKSKDKLVVNRISRVPHDPLTNLPTRYTEGLTDKQKKKYLKEIEETQKYYNETGKIKGSGSRPTVTGNSGPERWARARLASVLVGGKALAVDKDLVGPKSLKKIFN